MIDYLFNHLFLWELLKAAWNTLLLTVLAMPLAVVVGLMLALMRRSRVGLLSWTAAIYIEVVRGTPLLVQIFLVYYSLPQLGIALGPFWQALLTWNNFWVGVICLAGNYAAYQAEIHRAGLEAVPKGQREAGLSLGMTARQCFVRVELPQAFRIVLPPVTNDAIAMMKDSCLVSVIGVPELLQRSLSIGKERFIVPQMLVAAACLYLILSLLAYLLGRYLEKRFSLQQAPELKNLPTHGH